MPLAAAEVAQLVAFGATPPPRCGSWQALVDGVIADAAVTEASVGAFPIPTVVSTVDKQVVPGTELVVELGYLGGAGIHRGARLPGDRPGGRARPVAACGRRCRGSRCPGGVVPRRIAERGLLVPAALLDRGGWPALWQRAHR